MMPDRHVHHHLWLYGRIAIAPEGKELVPSFGLSTEVAQQYPHGHLKREPAVTQSLHILWEYTTKKFSAVLLLDTEQLIENCLNRVQGLHSPDFQWVV